MGEVVRLRRRAPREARAPRGHRYHVARSGHSRAAPDGGSGGDHRFRESGGPCVLSRADRARVPSTFHAAEALLLRPRRPDRSRDPHRRLLTVALSELCGNQIAGRVHVPFPGVRSAGKDTRREPDPGAIPSHPLESPRLPSRVPPALGRLPSGRPVPGRARGFSNRSRRSGWRRGDSRERFCRIARRRRDLARASSGMEPRWRGVHRLARHGRERVGPVSSVADGESGSRSQSAARRHLSRPRGRAARPRRKLHLDPGRSAGRGSILASLRRR